MIKAFASLSCMQDLAFAESVMSHRAAIVALTDAYVRPRQIQISRLILTGMMLFLLFFRRRGRWRDFEVLRKDVNLSTYIASDE